LPHEVVKKLHSTATVVGFGINGDEPLDSITRESQECLPAWVCKKYVVLIFLFIFVTPLCSELVKLNSGIVANIGSNIGM
jgi:hypothetical protein